MINVLIADDNLNYAISLMNYLNSKNPKIRVCKITKNGKETLQILNLKNDIDIILLDYKMPFLNANQILEGIINKSKYINSIIVISGFAESFPALVDNKMIYSIFNKDLSMNEMLNRINDLINYKETLKKSKIIKKKIPNEILYLGYNISHKGTKYLIEVIEYIIINLNNEVNILEKDVYPIISLKYGISVHNIKCRINDATNKMYYNCEIENLKKYFYLDIDIKPTVKSVINTIIYHITK